MLLITIALCILSAVDCARLHVNVRIVNGDDAKEGEYPYIVSIRGPKGGHKCGGSIISPEWILTAAHCIKDRNSSFFSVQYGVTEISKSGPNVVEVKKVIKHKQHNVRKHENDIGLIKLKEPLQYNEFVQPIPLADDPSQSKHGDPCTLVGWGRTANNKTAEHLQELHLQIIGKKQCQELVPSIQIFKSNICADYPGFKKTCYGDSGGPLTANGVQVGIVSWSKGPCQDNEHPGVYAKVSYYRDWILEHAGV